MNSTRLTPTITWSIFLLMAVSAFVAYNIATVGITYQAVIVIVVAVIGTIILLMGKRGWSIGLVGFVIMFALGYRTIHITDVLKLHPLDLAVVMLMIAIIIKVVITDREEIKWKLPVLLMVFMIFWPYGWLMGMLNSI